MTNTNNYYRWHKYDTESLPEFDERETLLICCKGKLDDFETYMTCSSFWLTSYSKMSGYDIIAWKHIEPYKENNYDE